MAGASEGGSWFVVVDKDANIGDDIDAISGAVEIATDVAGAASGGTLLFVVLLNVVVCAESTVGVVVVVEADDNVVAVDDEEEEEEEEDEEEAEFEVDDVFFVALVAASLILSIKFSSLVGKGVATNCIE